MMAHYAPAPPPLLHPIGIDRPPEPPNTEPAAGVGLKNSGGLPAGMMEHLEVCPDAVQVEERERRNLAGWAYQVDMARWTSVGGPLIKR